MAIPRCKSCQGENFLIVETIIHAAFVDNDKVLRAYKNKADEIDAVICKTCEAESASDDLKAIEFCN